MLVLSLPFIWIGVSMTVKRLRSANLPPHLVILFFIPFLNLLFFAVLCLWPESEFVPVESPASSTHLRRIIPESALGSAAVSLLITVPAGLAITLFSMRWLINYGWGSFVALPFTMGFTAALIYGFRQPRSIGGCIGVACLAIILLGAGLLALAFEGLFCLIMAIPIALPLAILGGAIGYLVQRRHWSQRATPALVSMMLIFVPGSQWIEHVAHAQPPVYVVHTSVEVQAPPEKVWKQVVAFTQIPPPTEWLFRAGIAYPIRAEMLGSGPGAERHCVFSTGAFVEPIQVWDEPRRLKFSVTSNPAPMQEWTPYSHIEPPRRSCVLTPESL